MKICAAQAHIQLSTKHAHSIRAICARTPKQFEPNVRHIPEGSPLQVPYALSPFQR